MPKTSSSSSKIAVLVDARDDLSRRAWSWGHVASDVREIASHEQLFEALRDFSTGGSVEVIAIQGKDRFLGEVMTAWHRDFGGGLERPLDFYPLPVDSVGCEVAASLADPRSLEKRIDVLIKKSQQGASRRARGFERLQVETLWVSSSLEDGGQYAFNMATGWFYDLWLATRKRGVSGLMQLARMGGDVARKLSSSREEEDGVRQSRTLSFEEADASQPSSLSSGVMMRDRQEVSSLPFGLLCGALPVTSFGVALSREGGARQVSVSEEAEAVSVMARARAPLKLLKGEAGERFEALHFEGLSEFMLDDQALAMEHEGMLYVRPGEPIWLVR